MRVLLVTQYFYPENFKSNDIAFELVKKGHQVDVLTGIPNYPEGSYTKGYGLFKRRVETIKGVRVYRSFQFPRGKGGGVRLLLNYASYVLSASFNVLFFFVFKKYDCTVVHAPSPITQAYPALLLKRLRGVPVYLWVMDIWPDAIISAGGIRNQRIIRMVDKMVRGIYRNCDKLLISSKRFTESILTKGDLADKIAYFPNWSADMLQVDRSVPLPELPKGFRIMLAGNLGKAQNLEAVMETVLLLREQKDIQWIFVGDGTKREWLERFVKAHQLEDVVSVMGRYPAERMPLFFEQADALLLTLKSGFPHLRMVVPARLQSYMSAGKPVLAMIDGGAVDIIEEANCGYAVPAGDSNQLAQVIRTKVYTDRAAWQQLGQNGRAYFEQYFTKEICIQRLMALLKK